MRPAIVIGLGISVIHLTGACGDGVVGGPSECEDLLNCRPAEDGGASALEDGAGGGGDDDDNDSEDAMAGLSDAGADSGHADSGANRDSSIPDRDR